MTPLSRFFLRALPLCALLVPGLVSAESATPTSSPKTTAAPKPAASKATSSPEKAAPKAEKTPKPATADKTDKPASGDKVDAPSSKGSMNMGDMFGGGNEFDLKTGPGGTLFTTTKDNALVKLIAKDPNGQVAVTNPQFTLHCETLTYVDATKQAVALGNPVTVEQPTATATCKKLEMYPGDTENKFVLTGNPVMRQKGQSSVTGDRITIIQHKADGSVDTFVDAPHVVSTGNKAGAAPTVPTTVVKQPTAIPSGGATIEIDTTKGGLKDGGISLPGMKSTAAPAPKSNQP